MTPKGKSLTSEDAEHVDETWVFYLYVAGPTGKSITAFENLKKLCDEHLPGRCKIEVIDISQNPDIARRDQIVAIPTLIKKLPPPVRKVIGDMSNSERVLVGLDLKAREIRLEVSHRKGRPER